MWPTRMCLAHRLVIRIHFQTIFESHSTIAKLMIRRAVTRQMDGYFPSRSAFTRQVAGNQTGRYQDNGRFACRRVATWKRASLQASRRLPESGWLPLGRKVTSKVGSNHAKRLTICTRAVT